MDVLRLERSFACKRKESDGIQNPFGAFFALKSRQIAGFLMDELKLKARPSCLIHGLWIPGIDTVIFDIVAHKLTVSKKVNLLVVPSDGGIDPTPQVGRQMWPGSAEHRFQFDDSRPQPGILVLG